MSGKTEKVTGKTGLTGVSCFNSYDVESATTEGKGKKSIFQKLLGTKTKKIVGIAIASIVVAMTVALTVALAASLGANSSGENIDPPVNETLGSGNETLGSGNETLGSGEIPTVNGTGLPTVNSTETPEISAETPVIPTEPPTINRDNYPSPDSLCGYRPEAAMHPTCVEHPFSLYENLNPRGMSESELKRHYYECVAEHTSTPCNNATAFSTVADLPDGIIYAFVGQSRNSTLPIRYDAGFDRCAELAGGDLISFDISEINTVLYCSARRSDIEALPSNCPCVPDSTIDLSEVPPVAPPTIPEDIFETPSDSLCGSLPISGCYVIDLSYYNSLENLSEASTNVAYEECAFRNNDAGCGRLPVFANVTITSDRIYKFAQQVYGSGPVNSDSVYFAGFTCLDQSVNNPTHITDELYNVLKSECLIERAVAAVAPLNCPCYPELGTITV